MKKWLSIALVLVLCLSMCACSVNREDDEQASINILKDQVLGKWEREYEADGETNVNVIDIYKGGTGRIKWCDTAGKVVGSNVSLEWEINDGVLNIQYSIAGSTTAVGYQYMASNDQLVAVADVQQVYCRVS